ncbi:MAG TPA: lipopolysaccharide assembly protein LapA domain-containing protein [Stellaceae bacterium]|nr:lipopolysaccharide assembly protein LapA domain-containing protein [Stellaceae bacterium]
MRAVYFAVIVVASSLLIAFAVSNRTTVSLGLWPLPFLIDLPLYLLVLLLLLAGFVAGAATAWIAGRRVRRELRRRRRRVVALEGELKAARSEL